MEYKDSHCPAFLIQSDKSNQEKKSIMNNINELDADCNENLSSKKVFAAAIGTGLFFWAGVFGIICFALRS